MQKTAIAIALTSLFTMGSAFATTNTFYSDEIFSTEDKTLEAASVSGDLLAAKKPADSELVTEIPKDTVTVSKGYQQNAENRKLTVKGSGSETLSIKLDGQGTMAFRSYAGDLTIENLDKISINGYTNNNVIYVQAPKNGSYQYPGTLTIRNVGTLEIGTKEKPMENWAAVHAAGGTLDINVNKFSVYGDGNAVWIQQTTSKAAKATIEADVIDLQTSGSTIGVAIFGDGLKPEENSASLSMKANTLSVVSKDSSAVTSSDGYGGNLYQGKTSISLTGTDSVHIEGKTNGVNVNRKHADGVNKTTVNIASEGMVYISGGENAVNINGVNEKSDIVTSIKAPTIELDGNVTLAGESAVLGLEGSTTINGIVSAANSTLKVDGEAIFNDNADIGTLAGSVAMLTLGDVDSKISVKKNSADKTTLGATGQVNDALSGDVNALLNKFEGEAKKEGTSVSMAEGDYAGATTATVGADGKATNVIAQTNSVMSNVLDLASATTLSLNRILMNDVRKRMGDLRESQGTHGVWARYDGGKLSGSNGLENDFTTIQAGIDTVPLADAPRFGVAFAYTTSDADMRRGNAEMDAFSLAFYGTKAYDNGLFVDVIGRMATANTDVVIDGNKKGSMDNVALSLSGELGWRFDLSNALYVEPQAELTYTYVDADTLKLSNGNSYKFDALNSMIGRAGFAAGLTLPNERGNVYVRTSAVHEFMGDATVTGGTGIVHEIDGKDTWIEYGIGANLNLTPTTYFWGDLERTAGATLETDWRMTVGVRHAF